MPKIDLFEATAFPKGLLQIIEAAPELPLTQLPICSATSASVSSYVKELGWETNGAAAGLFLLARDWDRSHTISQDLHDSNGSYWHGILHRIEGDYWNSKYWLRQIGNHTVRKQLVDTIRQRLEQSLQSTKPYSKPVICLVKQLNSPETVVLRLVDLVEKVVSNQTEDCRLPQLICWWEWQLQFLHSLHSINP